MNFQAASSSQGRGFEDAVVAQLVMAGWTILHRRWREPLTLVEVDIVAADPHGEVWWIECKGSWLSESGRNGCIRTDTVKKLIGSAAILATVPDRRPYLLATSHVPDPGTPAALWLDIAVAEGLVAGIEKVSTFTGRLTPGSP